MKIAVIGGTGDQGLGLAIRYVKAGEDVIIGSRRAEKAENAVDEGEKFLNESHLKNLQGMSNQDAAVIADVLILTVPLQAQKATLDSIAEYVNGKTLIDATAPLNSNIGGSPMEFIQVWEGSAAERTADILKNKDVSVVSAFSNISSSSLMEFEREIDCDCLVCGDDNKSKQIAIDLINKLPGVKAIDCGDLSRSRIVEKITPLLIGLNIKNKTHYAGIRITGLDRI
ncbi:NADP oxidoreductase coenzyme F420-dependent [Methanobrevibacter cuticularis]|uniref:NADP oxidoreductase coenzyme F420-dependent n=1 Tax=Methanobrevibacter cuticularis TaxID=47311 RepID=A0A166EYG6_9EURY|nr:NADPH-dependent F420 reductase [Methanobrevibacter cuticularis]KZX17142.1 NADP oxidoreductase coenzyme F420-dependent [Methanobrevibacter cuticularis]